MQVEVLVASCSYLQCGEHERLVVGALEVLAQQTPARLLEQLLDARLVALCTHARRTMQHCYALVGEVVTGLYSVSNVLRLQADGYALQLAARLLMIVMSGI